MDRPTSAAVGAALDAYNDSPADHRSGIQAALGAAYQVDRPASRPMEVAVAYCVAATWTAILAIVLSFVWK